MTDFFDLEISIFGFDSQHYRVELRFQNPDDPSVPAPVNGLFDLTPSALDQHALDPAAYGQALSQALFTDPVVHTHFQEGRAVSAGQNKLLRIRLYIDRSAADLFALRWETLADPTGGTWLLSDERTPFSRFLSNASMGKPAAQSARKPARRGPGCQSQRPG